MAAFREEQRHATLRAHHSDAENADAISFFRTSAVRKIRLVSLALPKRRPGLIASLLLGVARRFDPVVGAQLLDRRRKMITDGRFRVTSVMMLSDEHTHVLVELI